MEKRQTGPMPTSSVFGRSTHSLPSLGLHNLHLHHRYNRNNHFPPCPGMLPHHHHLHSHPLHPQNFSFTLSQAALAANNLSNLLSQSHLSFPQGKFQNYRSSPTPSLVSSSSSSGIGLGSGSSICSNRSGFSVRLPSHNSHNQSQNYGSNGKQPSQLKYQQQHVTPSQQRPNQRMIPFQGPAGPMQFNYFGESDAVVPSWNGSFCNGSGQLSGLPPPLPLDVLGEFAFTNR